MNRVRATLVALALLLSPASARSQILYLAFGDSVTYGTGDSELPGGYPPRLELLLREAGLKAAVENLGVAGETTAEALLRADSVLAGGGDFFLVMAGTNDVNLIAAGELSAETTIDNLDRLARKGAVAGARPVHATLVPRRPDAAFDRQNLFTLDLNWRIRDLAVREGRAMADPWHFFEPQNNPAVFATLYSNDPEDPVGHPDPAGYDLLAGIFADVLLDRDAVPPVMGVFSPGPVVRTIDPDTEIRVTLLEPEPGAGIGLQGTRLLINGRPVAEPEPESTNRKVELVYPAEEDLGCRAVVSVVSEDLADEPNALDREVATYDIRGRNVLGGDLDFDCRVDAVDLVAFAARYGAVEGDSLYKRAFDLNRNGVIDDQDLAALARNFGKSS